MVLEYEAQNFGYTEYPLDRRHDIVMNHVKQYVDTLVATYGDLVDAWVVAECPVTEPDNYWRNNIGESYASEVASIAKAGKSELKTFISETYLSDPFVMFDLEDFLAQNPGIDGINVVLTSSELDKSSFSMMLTDLANTGKLIRLSGLKPIGDEEDEADDLAYYISEYRKIIPADKQYGISFADAREAMWDSGFNRKAAYGKVADALK